MQTIMIISLSCFGWKLATSKGNVLSPIREITEGLIFYTLLYSFSAFRKITSKDFHVDRLADKVFSHIEKPLFTCVYCMASTSTLLFFISNDLELLQVDTAWMMLAVCGLNVVLSALVELAFSMKEFVKIN